MTIDVYARDLVRQQQARIEQLEDTVRVLVEIVGNIHDGMDRIERTTLNATMEDVIHETMEDVIHGLRSSASQIKSVPGGGESIFDQQDQVRADIEKRAAADPPDLLGMVDQAINTERDRRRGEGQ